jgi:alcohol dehydrogenase/L-iditol 2-dehydrogenase
MTSFVRVPARCLHHIPDTLPFYHGCLAEPCSVAYHAMCVNSSIRPGDSVVVIGPGPIGLLCLRLAALSGAYPLVMVGITADTARLETARELGATHVVNADTQDLNEFVRALAPLGADLVCDASGASGPLQAALTVTAPDGQITKVGWSPKQAPIDINPLVQKNMRLQGSFSHTYPMWEKVIHLMASGNMHLDKIIGLKTNLDDWRLAFDSMHQGKVIKSVLLPEN